MPCMKLPFTTEAAAVANRGRMNRRTGKGPTSKEAYPCPDCATPGHPPIWHLRTERPIEGKIARLTPRRHRPAQQPWQDEDYEGMWAA